MKLRHITALTLSLLFTQVSADSVGEAKTESAAPVAAPATKTEALTNPVDKLSYSFGQNIGNSLKRQETDINLDMIFKGIKDVLSGSTQLLTEQESMEVIRAFQQEKRAKQEETRKKQGEENAKVGEKFLAENKGKEGVVTLPSGLQYKVITAGKGKTPSIKDTVKTHYRGTLIDGTEFDSSYSRGEPAVFPVNRVIAGWTEALQLMKEGDKWQLFIPSKLAYGENGAGGKIGPNATLVFDIELLSIEASEEAKEPASLSEKVEEVKKATEGAATDKPATNTEEVKKATEGTATDKPAAKTE
jgi:FKBP-type peptidyl-prolyl cis-trans isomerase